MISSLTIELRIEASHSLKDKRQVVRSIKDRLRASFNVSVAELDPSNLWNQATIGAVAIWNSPSRGFREISRSSSACAKSVRSMGGRQGRLQLRGRCAIRQ